MSGFERVRGRGRMGCGLVWWVVCGLMWWDRLVLVWMGRGCGEGGRLFVWFCSRYFFFSSANAQVWG